MRKIARSLTTLLVVLVIYQAYSWLAVPLLEPSVANGGPLRPEEHEGVDGEPDEDLTGLFPPGSWELDSAKVLKTSRGIVLFQDYHPTEDGRVKLHPLSLVFFPEEGKSKRSEEPQRAIVVQAPEGATLQMDKALDLQSKPGRLIGGRLTGEVTIHGPESEPGANDQLHLVTRNVQLDDERIWTPHEVAFRYGSHFGRGRDLVIMLNDRKDAAESKGKSSVARSLELVHVDVFHLHLTESSSFMNRGEANAKASQPTPVEIRCRGPFEFDFIANRASFEKDVAVQRIDPSGVRDQMDCQILAVQFVDQNDSEESTGKSGMGNLKVKHVEAVGQPVTLNAPSMDAFARGTQLHFDLTTRRIRVQDKQRVTLRHRQHHVEAAALEYEVPEDPKRIGQLWAQGPGVFHTSGVGKQKEELVTRWQRELVVRPDRDGQHVISLVGGARAESVATGRVDADQIHLWIHEQPHPTSRGKFVLKPLRMLAQNNVRLNSPQLSGATGRMEVWIREQQQDVVRISSLPESQPEGPSGPTEQPGGLLRKKKPEDAPKRKFDINGQLIRIQVVRTGDKTHVDEVTVNGNVRLKEIRTEEPGTPPMAVNGASVWVKNTPANKATVTVQGDANQAAMISAEGMTLVGPAIRLSQVDNTVTINGAGEMVLPAGAGQSRAHNGSYQITWRGNMVFDGRRAHFEREVRAEGQHFLKSGSQANVTATGNILDVDLDRRVDFSNPKKSDDIGLWQLTYSGEFHAINHGVDPAGAKESTDQIHAYNLNINQTTGRIHADGPGWASTARFSKDPLKEESSSGPANPQADKPPQLIYSHIDFAKEMVGNLHRKEMQFHEQIRLVYGPIDRWDQQLDANRRETWGTDGFLLTSHQLSAAEVGPRIDKDIPIELEATGDVVVENKSYTARAARIAYTKAKELMLLEGDGRNEARIWFGNKPAPDAIARRILFWRKTKRFEIGWGKYFDFSRFGAPPADNSGQANPRTIVR